MRLSRFKIAAEIHHWAHSVGNKGQVYTKPEVVEFMLTAIGLKDGEALKHARILEPSCGEGEFVVAIAERLIHSVENKPAVEQLFDKVLAVDLVSASVETAKSKLGELKLVTQIAISTDYWIIGF